MAHGLVLRVRSGVVMGIGSRGPGDIDEVEGGGVEVEALDRPAATAAILYVRELSK